MDYLLNGVSLANREIVRITKYFISLWVNTYFLDVRDSLIEYRVFIKHCVFSFEFYDFSELCQFCCKRWGLTWHCVHTLTPHRGETERGQSPEYILKSSKKTQYLMNTLYILPWLCFCLAFRSSVFLLIMYCTPFHTGCSSNIVFSKKIKIFRTVIFLCFPSVSVCVHRPGR